MRSSLTREDPGVLTLFLLSAMLLWDAGNWDLPLARMMGSSTGFPLRDHPWLDGVLHAGARDMAWLVSCALCLMVVWPLGPLRRLPYARRLQLAVGGLIACASVAILKSFSHTSCPWDLRAFGGIAAYRSHWDGWLRSDGGAGHCFPAGHASTGFAFVTGWFALRRDLPGLARAWAIGAVLLGLFLGLVQQVRGAHFMSHTLWTGWICWTIGLVVDLAFTRFTAGARGVQA